MPSGIRNVKRTARAQPSDVGVNTIPGLFPSNADLGHGPGRPTRSEDFRAVTKSRRNSGHRLAIMAITHPHSGVPASSEPSDRLGPTRTGCRLRVGYPQGPMEGKSMTSVFVSHASQDDHVVAQVVSALRGSGHQVWVDQSELKVGGSLAGSIQEGIAKSNAFLLLYSRAAASSPWVELEWQAALSRALTDPTYALLLGRLDAADPPLLLQTKKWTDLSSDLVAGIAGLQQALEAPGSEDLRPLVWYFDDESTWIESFMTRHHSGFRIRAFNDAAALLSALLTTARRPAEIPDLLLIDLYAIKEGTTQDHRSKAESCVSDMIRAERQLRGDVDAAWRPVGVEIVDAVREFYPPSVLPLAMHTQQGLILLRDELIQQLESLGVGWILKNRFSPETDRMVLDRIARRSGHKMSSAKPRVLIIDDNPSFIKSFIERQSDAYSIQSITSEDEVMPTLSRLDASGDFPDLFLVDMYYPKGGLNSDHFIEVANQKLKEFAELETKAKREVQECFEPVGLSILRELRRNFSQATLPALVYTQSGLMTVGDEVFREIARLGGGWLLKDRYDARTEEVMICGELLRARSMMATKQQSGSSQK